MIDASVIEKVLRKYGLFEQYREQEPALLWERVVGEKIARLARPIWVQNDVLFVAVPNHIVQHEFTVMREEFRKKLNAALGAERVKEIRFRVENFPKARPVLALAPLTPDEEREIETLAADVPDAPLRAALIQLMKKAKQIERARQKLGWKPCPQCGVPREETFCPLCGQIDDRLKTSPPAPPRHGEGSSPFPPREGGGGLGHKIEE